MSDHVWQICFPAKKRHGDALLSWPSADREAARIAFRRRDEQGPDPIKAIHSLCVENSSTSKEVAPFFLIAASQPFEREGRRSVEQLLNEGAHVA